MSEQRRMNDRGGRATVPRPQDVLGQIPPETGLATGLSAVALVQYGNALGNYLQARGLKTRQIRKSLEAAHRLQQRLDKDPDLNVEAEAALLKIRLAYDAGRAQEGGSVVKELYDVLSAAIDRVHKLPDFERFMELLQAIVAFHRFHGGKD